MIDSNGAMLKSCVLSDFMMNIRESGRPQRIMAVVSTDTPDNLTLPSADITILWSLHTDMTHINKLIRMRHAKVIKGWHRLKTPICHTMNHSVVNMFRIEWKIVLVSFLFLWWKSYIRTYPHLFDKLSCLYAVEEKVFHIWTSLHQNWGAHQGHLTSSICHISEIFIQESILRTCA